MCNGFVAKEKRENWLINLIDRRGGRKRKGKKKGRKKRIRRR